MICNDTDRHIILILFPVLFACKAAYMISQCLDRIYIKNGIHVLHNAGQTLQPHSCINILLFQFRIIAVSVIIKLGEYIVPDLHITVTIASDRTVRLAASVFFSSVVINLGAGTTWS